MTEIARHTYRATLAYDGSAFAGYRRQPEVATVEGALVTALKPLIPSLEHVPCGGRTDKGVHATGQVISFWSRVALPHVAIRRAVDQAVPGALSLETLCDVPRSFHASFSAVRRGYRYTCQPDVSLSDLARLNALVGHLVGERCFSAFARDTPVGRSTVRHLHGARARERSGAVVFEFVAGGFLRRQVRIMVATALRAIHLNQPDTHLVALAERGDRRATQPAAPPGNLYLTHIGYEGDRRGSGASDDDVFAWAHSR